MKIKKLALGAMLLALGSIGFYSCKKEKFNMNKPAVSQTESAAQINLESPTILGKELKNPFAIDNMREAYKAITKNKSGEDLQPNRLYVRFLPMNAREMESIYDSTLNYEMIPLTYEVVSYGDYYQDPETEQLGTTWVYTTVPIDYKFNNVRYEIIDRLFLTDEEEDKSSIGIDLDLLESVALQMAGYEEEADATMEKAQKRPKGHVRFQQKIGSQVSNQPVKNIRVQSRWWFRYGNGYTNDNGYFECDRTYNHNRNVTVKVHFENNFAKIRGIKGLNFMHMFFVEDNTLGTFSNNALENISYVHTNSTNLTSNAKRLWIACHAINSLREYKVYAQQHNILQPPSNLNMWVTGAKREGGLTWSRYAAAPMLKQMANSSILNGFVKFVIAINNPLAAAVVQVMQQHLPDITYNYSEFEFPVYHTNTDEITEIFYHELAHASHYAKVGNNYWAAYIAYIVANNGYGSASSNGSGRTAISEAWAYSCAPTFAHQRFGNSTSLVGNETWQARIERFNPNTWSDGWIPKGLMHDLSDVGEPSNTGIIDNVSGYTLAQRFNAMTANVTSVGQYKNTFLNQNPGMNSTQMGHYNQLFSSYGY